MTDPAVACLTAQDNPAGRNPIGHSAFCSHQGSFGVDALRTPVIGGTLVIDVAQ